MGLFARVDKQADKVGVIKSCVDASLGQLCPHKELVLDELCIFLIVFELLVDFRTFWACEPCTPFRLNLPMWREIHTSDGWWTNSGRWDCLAVIPWHGRERVAKVLLLLHAATLSLCEANCSNDENKNDAYGYVDLWTHAIHHLGCHPLALQGSLIHIKTLLQFATARAGEVDVSDGVVQ